MSLFTPITALATSGACSYHGGVNCAAGASLYGNAQCNDGWESSTSFYNTDECKTSNCPAPIISGFVDIGSCNQLQDNCDHLNAVNCKTGFAEACVPTSCPIADTCRKQVAANDAMAQIFNQCLSNSEKKIQEMYDQALQTTIKPDPQLSVQEKLLEQNNYCDALLRNALYNQLTTKCECKKGFTYDQKYMLCEITPTLVPTVPTVVNDPTNDAPSSVTDNTQSTVEPPVVVRSAPKSKALRGVIINEKASNISKEKPTDPQLDNPTGLFGNTGSIAQSESPSTTKDVASSAITNSVQVATSTFTQTSYSNGSLFLRYKSWAHGMSTKLWRFLSSIFQ